MSEATDPTTILGKIGKKVGQEVRVLTQHTARGDNPHNVNKSQVGLGDVKNIDITTYAGSGNITTVGNLSSGTIPYSLLSGAPDLSDISSVNGNFEIAGNLTVKGDTTVLETQTLSVEDNIIEINIAAEGGGTSADSAGIEVRTGTATSLEETFATSGDALAFTKVGGNITTITYSPAGAGNADLVFNEPPNPVYSNTSLKGNFATDDYVTDDGNNSLTVAYGESDITEISYNDGNSNTSIATYSLTEGVAGDKPSILWDASGQSEWTFNVGASKADIHVNDVTAVGDVKVSAGSNLKINNVSVGDYAGFINALTYSKNLTSPVITLTGEAAISLNVGDAYTEQGASAVDDLEGALTVVVSGTVDPNTAGTYTVTYSATDSAGNTGTLNRTVTVS
jgi:hypothetical protein